MKVFIVLAIAVACAHAQSGFVSTYNAAYNPLTYATAPYYAAGVTPAVTYASPAQFGYQSVTHHGVAPAAVTYAAAPVASPIAYSAPVAIPAAATKTQYHAQDVLGQASFGYSYPGQAHHAVRDAAGNVRGSYAYINPDGNEIRVNYVADQGGFRADSNALPQAPVHVVPGTVAAAAVAIPTAPISVPADTPEVVEARIAHAHAHQEARARNLLFRAKRQIVAAAPLTYAAATYSSVHQPHAYTATTIQHPTAFSTYSAIHHPTAFSTYNAAVHHPTAYAAPYAPAAAIVAPATYTQIHNNPGHAVSYRVY